MTLIDRLSKLDAPDREVDALIVKHFGLENECPYWLHRFTRSTPMHLTASVDAAIALAERVLPGKSIDLLREAISELGKKYHWHICRTKPEQVRELPIQVCIAILRAKEASTL